MRIQPHENLAVWSIRQEVYGPGRFDPADRLPSVQADPAPGARSERIDTWTPNRPVPGANPTETVDLRPYGCACPTPTTGADLAIPMTEIVTTPADLAPAMTPGAVQGYFQGQPVPTTGNLLDLVA